MSEGLVIALITSATTIFAALIGLFGSLIKEVGRGKDFWVKIGIIGLIVSGFGLLGLILGLIGSTFFLREVSQAQNPITVPLTHSSLTINGVSYPMPDPSSSPYCVAQQVHTNGKNTVDYDLNIPSGWVMIWNSWQAKWDGGHYDENGLLIIRGPWSGRIQINTGGSCSGPVEWYDFIRQNRLSDYPVPSRPEYNIP